MQTVPLGSSALHSSRLGYGCWRLAGTWNPAEVTAEKSASGRRAALAAFEAGYTFFDHADVYCLGVAESIFGELLREVSGMRERVVIATKCGIRVAGEPAAESPYRYDFSAEHITRSCEDSLRRLGVETIDLLMLHRADWLMDPAEVARAFAALRAAGKVREFGVSNFRPAQLTALQSACPMPLICNQVEISLAKLACFEDGTLDQCLAEKIAPLAWAPLGAGRLAGAVPGALGSTLERIAAARETSTSIIALAWLLLHPAAIVPIIGSTNPDRIRDAARAAEIELSRDEWYLLLEAARGARLP